MRTTPYGEPSDKEIDALRMLPMCPKCNWPVEEYDELCDECQEKEQEDCNSTNKA